MHELKPISRDAIEAALTRAERYRLLNEPLLAESICLDILDVEPENQNAIVMLLLSQTDRFGESRSTPVRQVRALLPRLTDAYSKLYYEGVICERQAKAVMNKGTPGTRYTAYEHFREAMEFYEQAEKIGPEGNDEAILRWNTCARILNRHPELGPAPEESQPQLLE